MASSGTYKDRNFNLAAQGRQPGSAFKTFVLVTALGQGVDPNSTTYVSKPLDLNVPGYGPWRSRRTATATAAPWTWSPRRSRPDNTVYAQLDIDLGPKNVRETAEMMGITTPLDGLPAEGLGGLRLGVSPLEMANAYATLASYGIHNEPRHHEGRVPRRQDRTSSASRSASGSSPSGSRTRRRRSSSRTCSAARARRRRSAATPPARPGRPTTSTTRGSSATRAPSRGVGLGRLPERAAR